MKSYEQLLPEGSHFADQRSAREAVSLMLPTIEAGMASKVVGDSGFLYIVVMDPAIGPCDADFEHAVLYEHAIGDRTAWDADYASFARDKARIAWRTGMSGHAVRHISPHLLRPSDTGIWGSAYIEGIAVGVAGAYPWYDEAIAASVAHWVKAIAKQRALAVDEAPRLTPAPDL